MMAVLIRAGLLIADLHLVHIPVMQESSLHKKTPVRSTYSTLDLLKNLKSSLIAVRFERTGHENV